MSSLITKGNANGTGSVTLESPNTNSDFTLSLPAQTATIATLTTPSFGTTIGVGGATPSTSGAGITFPATQSASTDANTLDDYEEGTWTPSLTFNGSATGQTGTFAGFYTKTGNQVFATCRIDLTAKGSSTGGASISGLPFTANSNSNYRAMSSTIAWGTLATNQVIIVGLMGPSYTTIDLYNSTVAVATNVAALLQHTDVNNTTTFRISITYQV